MIHIECVYSIFNIFTSARHILNNNNSNNNNNNILVLLALSNHLEVTTPAHDNPVKTKSVLVPLQALVSFLGAAIPRLAHLFQVV